MMKSMTGYGKNENTCSGHYFKMEIRSVNHRYLDVTVRVPRSIQYMEEPLRRRIMQSIRRGKVELVVTYECNAEGNYDILVDFELVAAYKKACEEMAQHVHIQNDLSVSQLIGLTDVIQIKSKQQDEQVLLDIALGVLDDALLHIDEMKREEGQQLVVDIKKKTRTIRNMVKDIEKIAPLVPAEYRERLMRKVADWKRIDLPDESRLMTEIALMAERCCIDEELVRLKSHIDQMDQLLSSEDAAGKKMDFLVQEMNREINTIGSKANHLRITQYVVECKSEMEKIREQIQNIE